MADSELEEFRQIFESLPHHLRASAQTYTMEVYRDIECVSSTEFGDPGVQFSVKKIIKRNLVGNQVYYFVKWESHDDDDDVTVIHTWELRENLECVELITAFEEEDDVEEVANKKYDGEEEEKDEVANKEYDGEDDKKEQKIEMYNGHREEDCEKIIFCDIINGVVTFLVKFKNSENAELIPAKIANLLCPQVVIAFYEPKLTWSPPKMEKKKKKKKKKKMKNLTEKKTYLTMKKK